MKWIIVIFQFCFYLLYSQNQYKYTQNWAIADSALMHFDSLYNISFSKINLKGYEVSTTFTLNQNVLFFDSEFIYLNNQPLYTIFSQEWNDLRTSSSNTQPSVFLPLNDSIVQFVTFGIYEKLTICNINLNTRSIYNIKFLYNSNKSDVNEKIVVCKHANGRDWWVFYQPFDENKWSKFLIGNDEFYGSFDQFIGSLHYSNAGQGKFSKNGDYLVSSNQTGDLDVYHFDNYTGLLFDSLYFKFPGFFQGGLYGLEISANSNKVYVANGANGMIF